MKFQIRLESQMTVNVIEYSRLLDQKLRIFVVDFDPLLRKTTSTCHIFFLSNPSIIFMYMQYNRICHFSLSDQYSIGLQVSIDYFHMYPQGSPDSSFTSKLGSKSRQNIMTTTLLQPPSCSLLLQGIYYLVIQQNHIISLTTITLLMKYFSITCRQGF